VSRVAFALLGASLLAGCVKPAVYVRGPQEGCYGLTFSSQIHPEWKQEYYHGCADMNWRGAMALAGSKASQRAATAQDVANSAAILQRQLEGMRPASVPGPSRYDTTLPDERSQNDF